MTVLMTADQQVVEIVSVAAMLHCPGQGHACQEPNFGH